MHVRHNYRISKFISQKAHIDPLIGPFDVNDAHSMLRAGMPRIDIF
jgi:hypothetical protein